MKQHLTENHDLHSGIYKELSVTPDEEAVVQHLRSIAFGKVIATVKEGMIVHISREETFVPPTNGQRLNR